MLIGIMGAAGAGKDTLAYQLQMRDAYEIYRMADPIKRMIEAAFHVKPQLWDDRERKEAPIPWLGRSPRYLAQTLGTEWGRELVHPDVWVKLAKGRWHHVNAQGKGRLVIPDIRFANEVDWVRSEGGVLVKLVRDVERDMDNAGHVSELGAATLDADATVVNNGTVDELRQAMWDVVLRVVTTREVRGYA